MNSEMTAGKRIAITALQGLWGRCSQALLGLALGWAVLVGYGCKEKEPIVPETVYMDKDYLSYCHFPAGSYWIYEEDSTSGWTDSMYVKSSSCFVTDPENGTYLYEFCLMQYFRRGLEFKFMTFPDRITVPFERTVYTTWDEELFDGGLTDNGEYIFFRDEGGFDTLTYRPETYIESVEDSITVGIHTYSDAITVFSSHIQHNYSFVRLTFCKNVGIVKMELIDGTSWSLLRYHIS